jgi:hypothetical protein
VAQDRGRTERKEGAACIGGRGLSRLSAWMPECETYLPSRPKHRRAATICRNPIRGRSRDASKPKRQLLARLTKRSA